MASPQILKILRKKIFKYANLIYKKSAQQILPHAKILKSAIAKNYCSGESGESCQMPSAYSFIVRSDENLPIRAVLRIAIFAHAFLSL